MKTNDEWIQELHSELKRFKSPERREGVLTAFVVTTLERKDYEWKEKMIEVLEGMPVADGSAYDYCHAIDEWRNEKLNELKCVEGGKDA